MSRKWSERLAALFPFDQTQPNQMVQSLPPLTVVLRGIPSSREGGVNVNDGARADNSASSKRAVVARAEDKPAFRRWRIGYPRPLGTNPRMNKSRISSGLSHADGIENASDPMCT